MVLLWKTILDQGQSGLMRWIFDETGPRCRFDWLTCWYAVVIICLQKLFQTCQTIIPDMSNNHSRHIKQSGHVKQSFRICQTIIPDMSSNHFGHIKQSFHTHQPIIPDMSSNHLGNDRHHLSHILSIHISIHPSRKSKQKQSCNPAISPSSPGS